MKKETNLISSKGFEREQQVRITKPSLEDPEKVMKRHQDNMNIQRILKEKEMEVKKAHKEMKAERGQRYKQIRERLRKEPVVSRERQIEIAKEIDERIKQGHYD